MASQSSLIADKDSSSGPGEKRTAFLVSPHGSGNPFLGTSAAIRQLENRAIQSVNASAPVLILGESGSGKGMVAHWLHENGPRGEELHVQLPCRGVSQLRMEATLFGCEKGSFGTSKGKPGLLEIAQGGSIFIDEISEMALPLQKKILRALNENKFCRLGDSTDRELDVRLVASSERDLAKKVQQNRFMKDLYLRFGEPLVLPPLRNRMEDLPLLVKHLLERIATEQEISHVKLPAFALLALQASSWPGNIRQLRNTLERAVLANESTSSVDLDGDRTIDVDSARQRRPLQTLEEMERQYIQEVLSLEGGRVQSAARKLGIPRSSLYHKLKQYRMSRGESESTRWNQAPTGA